MNKIILVTLVGLSLSLISLSSPAQTPLQDEVRSGALSDTGMMIKLERLNPELANILKRLPEDKKLDLLSIDKIARHADDDMERQLGSVGLQLPVVGRGGYDQLAEAITVILLHGGYINYVSELAAIDPRHLAREGFFDQFAKKVVAGQEGLAPGENGIIFENFKRNIERVFRIEN